MLAPIICDCSAIIRFEVVADIKILLKLTSVRFALEVDVRNKNDY